MSSKNKNFAQSYVGTQKVKLSRAQKQIGLTSMYREKLSGANGLFSGILGMAVVSGFSQGFTTVVIGVIMVSILIVVRVNTVLMKDTILKHEN